MAARQGDLALLDDPLAQTLLQSSIPAWARIAIRPEWTGILDFETRFPSALSG